MQGCLPEEGQDVITAKVLKFFFSFFTLSSLLEYNLRTVITLSFPRDHCNALYSYYYNQKQPRAAQFSRRKRRDSCVGICHVAKSLPPPSDPPRCADTFKKFHRVPVIWPPRLGLQPRVGVTTGQYSPTPA